MGFPGGSVVKNLPASAVDIAVHNHEIFKKMQAEHNSARGCKELDMTDHTPTHTPSVRVYG